VLSVYVVVCVHGVKSFLCTYICYIFPLYVLKGTCHESLKKKTATFITIYICHQPSSAWKWRGPWDRVPFYFPNVPRRVCRERSERRPSWLVFYAFIILSRKRKHRIDLMGERDPWHDIRSRLNGVLPSVCWLRRNLCCSIIIHADTFGVG